MHCVHVDGRVRPLHSYAEYRRDRAQCSQRSRPYSPAPSHSSTRLLAWSCHTVSRVPSGSGRGRRCDDTCTCLCQDQRTLLQPVSSARTHQLLPLSHAVLIDLPSAHLRAGHIRLSPSAAAVMRTRTRRAFAPTLRLEPLRRGLVYRFDMPKDGRQHGRSKKLAWRGRSGTAQGQRWDWHRR